MVAAVAPQDTTAKTLFAHLRGWKVPFVAWLISRLIGCLGLVVWPNRQGEWFNTFGLTFMDGALYRMIVTTGFPNGELNGSSVVWPFFPLYPWTADLLTRLGAPVGPSLILVSWIGAFVALLGVWRLANIRFDESVARNATWCLAVLPGAVGQVLSYSDSLFVAGLVWTLVLIDRVAVDPGPDPDHFDRRWLWAGLTAFVAVASRPNGILVLPVLLLAVWLVQRKLRNVIAVLVPSLVFFGGWLVYCRNKTGDALAFLTTKDLWLETTIFDFLARPMERPAIVFHMVVFVVVVLVAAPAVKKIPVWWLGIIFVFIGPSLLLGVEGMARYVTITVPLSILVAITLTNWPTICRRLFFVASAGSMLYLAVNVVRSTWVP